MALSSAIVCDRDRRIADDRRSMFPYDRRPHCDLRSAIILKPALRTAILLINFTLQIEGVAYLLVWQC